MTVKLTSATLSHAAALKNSYPFSMVMFLGGSISGDTYPMSQEGSGGNFNFKLDGNSSGETINDYSVAQGAAPASKSAAPHISASAMQIAVMVFTSASSRTVYFGSATGVTTTTTQTAPAHATHNIVKVSSSSNTLDVAEVHGYGVALTSADVTSIMGGTLPETITGWIDGWSLKDYSAGGSYTSLGGTRTLSVASGTTAAGTLTHPLARTTPDTTAPVLSSPVGTQTGSTTATVGATTDEVGTLYAVITTTNTQPTIAQIKAGQNASGAAAAYAANQNVTVVGAKTFAATGLTPSTAYYSHLIETDAAGNDSNIVTSSSFTTAAGADVTVPTQTGSLTVGTVTATSIQITWPAGADNVAVTSYETSLDGTSWTDRGNVLTYTFSGLNASTSYTPRVRAKDAAGNVSTPALQVTQSTSAATDSTPPTLTGSITPSSITLTTYSLAWPAGADNVAVTGYEVSLDGGTTYTDNGNSTSRNVTGRTASTTDQVRVRAYDSSGNRSTPALSVAVTLASPSTGTITTPPLKNKAGVVLANLTGLTVNVYHPTTGALVVQLTNVTTNGSGIATLSSGSIVAGQTYAVEVVHAIYGRRLPTGVAA
jgi:hypothetical protein